ncbi:hypothetical protein EMA8858_03876 [Emticicia aquatica]|uniref:Ricin B lectin domain-containing protein n=1 Tax=Emticicia aquatica TaxID=1681835 RepID=A0ABN8F2T8_9BACT|nr:RICIN domain-containing protein [Emticicia aquatica]CAH0997742.1 hypothetical protein EMA8858_03876 [Emticicia aquatica]
MKSFQLIPNNVLNRMAVFNTLILSLVSLMTFAQIDKTNSYAAEGRYLLRNVATGKYLTMTGSKYENGTAMSQANYNKDYNQQFYVSRGDDDLSVRIGMSSAESLLMSVNESAATNANGAAVKLLEDVRDLPRMQWKLVPTARPRVFTILSLDANSKRAIGVLNSTFSQVVQWKIQTADTRFQWEFIPIIEAGWYALQNVGTGLVMTTKQAAKINGTPLVVAESDTSDVENNPISMKFELIENGANVYNLTPGHTYAKKWVSAAASGTGLTIASENESLQNFEIKYVNDITKGFNDERFTIRSVNSQKLLGVVDGSNNVVIQGTGSENDEDYQWQLIPLQPANYLQEGTYVVQNVENNLVMDVAGAKLQNGTNIVQWGKSDAANQTFEVRINDDCKYQLLPVIAKATKYMAVTNKAVLGTADNTTLLDAIYAGEGIVVNNEDESNIYVLKSKELSLGVVGNSRGSSVIAQNTPNLSDSFKWRFIPVDADEYLESGLYTIQNVNTGLMMDVAGASTTNGSKVIQYARSNANNQKFEVSINDNGQYNIAPVYAATKWFSVTGVSTTNANASGTQLFINDGDKAYTSVSWGLNKIVDENSEDQNIFSIISLHPASKKVLGVYSSTDRRVVQLDGDPETDNRLQWRFIPTTKLTSNGRMSAELLSESEPENLGITPTEFNEIGSVSTQINIFPNPVKNDFNVTFNQFELNENLSVRIVDGNGLTVFQKDIGLERTQSFNVQHLKLKDAIYYIEVTNGVVKKSSKIVFGE